MLVVNTKEIFGQNLHQNRVHFPAERNAFVYDHQHGRHDITCKPAINETFFVSSRIPHSPCNRGPTVPVAETAILKWSWNRFITKNGALISDKSIVTERQCKSNVFYVKCYCIL